MHRDPLRVGTHWLPALIVGRSAERVLLQEQLAQAEAGNGQLVILGGEAGIGKTTLARDLAATATERGSRVIIGHCYDLTATPPYGLWRDLAADYRAEQGLSPLPEVLAGPPLDDVKDQAELFQGVRVFLDALAASRPTVVILEDAHWSDPASLELLRHIGSHLTGRRLLILVTYRVDELTRQLSFYRQLPALVRETGGLRLNLRRLTAADVGLFIDQSFALPTSDRDRLTSYLDEHAEGNPFFVVELLQALIDEGRLVRTDEGWALGPVDRIVVSALLRQVFEDRLTRLGETTRGPLQMAAVIGQEFSLDLWMAITGQEHDVLLGIVERAVEAHIFGVRQDETHIHFVHALTRATIYDSILPLRRAGLHRSVGEALLAQRDPEPDAVAYHFMRARDERAPKWLIEAGERAQRAYAWRTAFERFAAAADLLQGESGEELTRARLLYRCGRLLRYSDATNGIVCLDEASRLAGIAADKVLVAHAIYSCGLLRCLADDWQRGIAEMQAGIEALETLPLSEGESSWTLVNWMADALPISDAPVSDGRDAAARHFTGAGRGTLPWFLATVGRLAEAATTGEAFMRCIESVEPGPLVISAAGHCRHGLAIAHASLGEVEHAHEELDRARRHYAQLDHHAAIAFTWLVELRDVIIPFSTTDLRARRQAADGAREALEQAGGALLSAVLARRADLALCLLDGRWEQARAIVAAFPDSGNHELRREIVATLAPISWWQGRPEETWSYVREWLPLGPATPPGDVVLQDGLLLQRLAAAMSLAAGQVDDARAWLEASDRWLAWSGAVRGRAENRTLWARLELAGGSVERASMRAGEAVAAAMAPMQPLALCGARRVAGIVAMRSGNESDAARELEQAVALADACGAVYERIQTRIALAQSCLNRGAGADVRSLLDAAAADCARAGATPAAQRIQTMLAAGSPPADGDQRAALTAREREVLALVAHGMTDAEVADQLFISPRTVSQHLRSIYGKLEVSSRAGATRYAVQHHLG